MTDQNKEKSTSAKPKKPSAYDEPFFTEKPVRRETVARPVEPAAPARTESAASAKPTVKKATVKRVVNTEEAPTEEKPRRVHASTAQPPKKKKAEKKEKEPATVAVSTDDAPRSAHIVHTILPYVFYTLAVVLGVTLIVNLFCNSALFDPSGNHLASDPSQHWMSYFGFYLCNAINGVFGPAALVIPFLFVNLGLFWKRYVDHKLTISKIVASVLFLIVLSATIHVFNLFNPDIKAFFADNGLVKNLGKFFQDGIASTGGGFVGGVLGHLLYTFGDILGALIIEFVLLIASFFYLLGMTPQHVWNAIRNRQKAHPKKRDESASRKEAEEAENRAKMEEKIRRTTTGQARVEDDDTEDFESDAPVGAVRVVRTGAKKAAADELAPMPTPRLDPNDGSNLFVPEVVNQKMAQMEEEEALANELAIRQAAQAAAEQAAAKAAAEAAAKAAAEKPIDPAANRDAAVDPIFPKMTENRTVRRIPRTERNFDLGTIFSEEKAPAQPMRKHAPVPPEVPPTGTVRPQPATQQPAARPAVRPATPAAQARPEGAAPVVKKPQTVDGTVRPPIVKKAPAPTDATQSTQKPLPKAPAPAAKKPVFSQVTPTKREFGLTNEEFEKLEAQQVTLPRAGTPKKPTPPAEDGAKKDAPAKPATPKPTVEKKPAKPKRYIFPPISYLHPSEPISAENMAEIHANMESLATTLKSFHVGIENDIRYSCGPTVTRYEITPAPGVRVRSITNLSDDIALALRAPGKIRIEAPIPGTNTVGIEVPNRSRSTIFLRELIESKPFTESKNKLTACLGAGTAGEPLVFEINKMPHLLVAGTTNSGKSVCINSIIMSLIYRLTPEEVKFVMIDPKKVEFAVYQNIPHLMAPVVTAPADAAGALQASVEEMERRYELFAQVGVRDIKGYTEATADDPDMPHLPYIVIIIDELADLMMTARDEVETAICRIAQKARAAGMHLIIGTQRPSADVVTGLIKSNVPSRIAFTVKSQVDSRVILDGIGAEALTGMGDMLFVPVGAMRNERVQGAFVSDKEVEKICEFIRATNGSAQYDEAFIAKLKELASQCGNKGKSNADLAPVDDGGDKVADPKYADAVRVAIEEKRVSTSLLQRKLEVGYSRAAKLIDRMQSEGIVSPPDGSKPRTILITPEEYMEKFIDNPEAAD